MRQILYPFLILGAAALIGCSGAQTVPDAAENRTAVYEPGSPNFDIEVVSTVQAGRAGVDLYVSIPQSSLVYVKSGDEFTAKYELYVSAKPDGEDQPSYQETWSDTAIALTYEATQSFSPVLIENRVDLEPGEYVVEMTLEDGESGAQTVRRQSVDVIPPGREEVSLSEILLRASRSGGLFEPTVSIHVPSGYDSLQAVTQLYNVPDTAEVRLSLIRFASDTTIATPPYWFTPAHFTLPYIGVDYEDKDTLQVSRRTVLDASSEFSIEFDLPVLEEGVYLTSVQIEGGPDPAESRRYFTVRGPTFPRITSLEDMVASLIYIAREDEMKHIQSAESDEELKRRFDVFWAERLPNKQAAANLLASYYERVEQANILFTNHKDGWKTDRGMIYIVFGAPVYVDNRFTRRDWYYFERGSIVSRLVPPFIFQQSTAYGLSGLFENFVLQRSEGYEEAWGRKREDWRDGTVL